MTKANGTAHCHASATCRIGWMNRSKPATPTSALAILSAFVEARRVGCAVAPDQRAGRAAARRRASTSRSAADNFA